jgi:hypothetical protein
MNAVQRSKTIWDRWRDKILDAIPATLAASIATLGGVSGGLWLDVRDLSHQAREWSAYMDSRADCAGRSECDAVRAKLHEIEARLAVSETHVETHEKSAGEWKQRILENERALRQMRTSPEARPDPFTGTEGRQLEMRIERLEDLR